MTTPDTSEAVAKALMIADQSGLWWQEANDDEKEGFLDLAKAAIEADRKELSEQGYVIVKLEPATTADLLIRQQQGPDGPITAQLLPGLFRIVEL